MVLTGALGEGRLLSDTFTTVHPRASRGHRDCVSTSGSTVDGDERGGERLFRPTPYRPLSVRDSCPHTLDVSGSRRY